MAKWQDKTTRFSIQPYYMAHYRATEGYATAVEELFNAATGDIATAAAKISIDTNRPFSFKDYPSCKKILERTADNLASDMRVMIEEGASQQWLYANKKNDAFLASIMDTSKLDKSTLSAMQDANLDALKAFQGRKVNGLDLSQRVWKYVDQYKDQIEQALDVGLGEGRSAQQLARDVKQNLVEPDRLFRRVRDKRGNLVLSKSAKAYHPGTGVYRSSVRNAQRLTRSEINMAYRESDWERWQDLDFVLGYEIHRSNHNPLCNCPMCAKLVGRYPKAFRFVGWHPQCMCYATPILMTEEDFNTDELSELRAALHGTEYRKHSSANAVDSVPDGFTEWVRENVGRQRGWSSTPYFIRDNFVDGLLSKGLKPGIVNTTKTMTPME